MDGRLEKFVLGTTYLISFSIAVLGLWIIHPILNPYAAFGLGALILVPLAASALSLFRKMKLRLPLSWEVWPVVIAPLAPFGAFFVSPLWVA